MPKIRGNAAALMHRILRRPNNNRVLAVSRKNKTNESDGAKAVAQRKTLHAAIEHLSELADRLKRYAKKLLDKNVR